MRHLHLQTSATPIDYPTARELAQRAAAAAPDLEQPVLMAWHDGRRDAMSPAIPGADTHQRWRDYGASHCGCLEVSVGDDYDFVFADGAPYADYGPSPYVNVTDARGIQYICLRQPAARSAHADPAACVPLDDHTAQMT